MDFAASTGLASSIFGTHVLLDQLEDERGGADLERSRDLAHVGIANDDVEAAVPGDIGVGLVAGIDDRAPVHRVDGDEHAEEIRALRNLEEARLAGSPLPFPAHLAGARIYLARDEERDHARDDAIPRHIAAHEIIVVATVGVADEVGIVLVEADLTAGVRELLVPAPGALFQDALAGLVLGDQLAEGGALRRRVLRVGVIVVEAGAV